MIFVYLAFVGSMAITFLVALAVRLIWLRLQERRRATRSILRRAIRWGSK